MNGLVLRYAQQFEYLLGGLEGLARPYGIRQPAVDFLGVEQPSGSDQRLCGMAAEWQPVWSSIRPKSRSLGVNQCGCSVAMSSMSC